VAWCNVTSLQYDVSKRRKVQRDIKKTVRCQGY